MAYDTINVNDPYTKSQDAAKWAFDPSPIDLVVSQLEHLISMLDARVAKTDQVRWAGPILRTELARARKYRADRQLAADACEPYRALFVAAIEAATEAQAACELAFTMRDPQAVVLANALRNMKLADVASARHDFAAAIARISDVRSECQLGPAVIEAWKQNSGDHDGTGYLVRYAKAKPGSWEHSRAAEIEISANRQARELDQAGMIAAICREWPHREHEACAAAFKLRFDRWLARSGTAPDNRGILEQGLESLGRL